MRRGFLSISLALFVSVLISSVAQAYMVDRIVATVNGEIITWKELDKRVQPFARSKNATSDAQLAELRKTALDNLILQKLILQKGRSSGIRISDEEINEAIDKIKESNNLSSKDLESQLQQRGTNLALFREDLKVDITKARLIDKEVRSRIVVPDEAVYDYLKSQGREVTSTTKTKKTATSSDTSKVHVRNIFFELPQNAGQEYIGEQVAKAEKVRAEIQGGLNFAAAAAMHSDSSTADAGGDMGLISWDDMNERLREVLKGLRPGDISRPIVLGGGVHIFQIVDVQAGGDVNESYTEEDVTEYNISRTELENVRKLLIENKLKEKFEEWVKELEAQAIVKKKL